MNQAKSRRHTPRRLPNGLLDISVLTIPVCRRKQRYANKNAARDAALFSSKRTGDAIEAYKCKHCHGYHIGHASRVG